MGVLSVPLQQLPSLLPLSSSSGACRTLNYTSHLHATCTFSFHGTRPRAARERTRLISVRADASLSELAPTAAAVYGGLLLGGGFYAYIKSSSTGSLLGGLSGGFLTGLEDDLRARCHKSSSDVDEERFKEVSFLPSELTEKISVVQITKQNEDRAIIPVGMASVAALAFAVAGLVSCSQAWAAPEIASVQDAASWLGDLDDIKSGFLSAFLLIFFSEIGDKTFFIAAVLASRKSNAAVFTGTFGALVAMTFISVFLGRTFHYIDGILPFSLGENEFPLDDLAAVILLVYFGISTLLEAASMEGSKAEEEQQEAELAIAGLGANGKGSTIANTALATFGLVFVAEWGDKSFFSTVALSAASSPIGVVSGAIAGHGVATLLAVLGGSFLSSYISEKVTAYIGGSLFLIFAAFTLYGIVS